MRRGPEENDRKEPDCWHAQVVCYSGPANQHWYRLQCSTPNHDILCRGAFEAECVNEDIKEYRGTG